MAHTDEPTTHVAAPGSTPEQKSVEPPAADAIDRDDPHKVEKLSRLGHADDEAVEGTE